MKKTIVKAVLAATMLLSVAFGQGEGVITAASTPAKNTKAPVMLDNLSKYGLKKDVELPVTVTAGGLSYTLEKIMIYDIKSKDAQALKKLYQYLDFAGSISNPEYLIWTKITITNNSKKLIQQNYKDLNPKWRIFFNSGMENGEAYPPMSISSKYINNSKNALYNYKLKPGESLATYQALYYQGEFKYCEIFMNYNNQLKSQYVVNDPGTN